MSRAVDTLIERSRDFAVMARETSNRNLKVWLEAAAEDLRRASTWLAESEHTEAQLMRVITGRLKEEAARVPGPDVSRENFDQLKASVDEVRRENIAMRSESDRLAIERDAARADADRLREACRCLIGALHRGQDTGLAITAIQDALDATPATEHEATTAPGQATDNSEYHLGYMAGIQRQRRDTVPLLAAAKAAYRHLDALDVAARTTGVSSPRAVECGEIVERLRAAIAEHEAAQRARTEPPTDSRKGV